LIAAEQGHTDVVRVLIGHGANLELAEQNGYTPLTRAIWRGQSAVIALLQGAGARCQPVEILEEPAHSDCMAGQK
jgi:ankyrin repeat protein